MVGYWSLCNWRSGRWLVTGRLCRTTTGLIGAGWFHWWRVTRPAERHRTCRSGRRPATGRLCKTTTGWSGAGWCHRWWVSGPAALVGAVAGQQLGASAGQQLDGVALVGATDGVSLVPQKDIALVEADRLKLIDVLLVNRMRFTNSASYLNRSLLFPQMNSQTILLCPFKFVFHKIELRASCSYYNLFSTTINKNFHFPNHRTNVSWNA
jgi:hypothetical protein